MSALEAQVGGDHYRKMKIQPIEFIQANDIPFSEGCVIKYVARWKAKNGLQDLEKAKHYIELLIDHEKKRIADASARAAGARARAQDFAPPPGVMLFSQNGTDRVMARCICQSPADCSGQCYQGSMPL